ncbi:nuclear transport factor 2 family protein [Kitasatospora hibisci]|uniref:nuclear transport factor 2 family protein n=1 Tax=Kitasatospora hibisci TaxID=3369522 RepID=UPI0037551DBA
MSFRTTAEVIDRFNRAFTEHDASLLTDLIADDCVMEANQPAPDGARYEGRTACLEFWQALADDRTTRFEPENVLISGEHATVRWRYRFGDGPTDSVRGVNLTTVRNGLIVESLGYSKTTGDVPLAADGLDAA